MTEADALRRFERENAQVRALAARVREVRAEFRAASLAPNPSITYTREDSAGTQDSFLLVQQELPITGRLGLLRRAGDSATSAAQASTNYSLLLLRSEFRLAFYALLLAQQRETHLAKSVNDLDGILSILRDREHEGEGSKFDQLRAERELADARANHASAQVLLAQARSRLAAMLAPGTEPASLSAKGEVAGGAALPPVQDLVARALDKRGDFAARRNDLQRFEYEERAAQRLRIPEPVLSAGLKRTTLPGVRDSGYAVSVTVPIPLFNRGQTEVERTRAAQERTQTEIAAHRQQIETEVKATYEGLRLRRQIAEQYAKELGQKGAELSRIAQIAYQEGEQGILELLDAYRTALFSRLQALELAWSAKQAEIELNRAVGEEVLP
ncbi:MAG: TolC family protein [Acidobacteria bacterium]|nr:TolC family protein [Acidobacteriota bacterium]